MQKKNNRHKGADWFALTSSMLANTKNIAKYNTAVIDRRLRPRCCYLGSYFKRPKCSPAVRARACNWYNCAQFVAKPKAACVHCA